MGHGYHRNNNNHIKRRNYNPVRRIELAIMRLDRIYTARIIMGLIAAQIIIMSVLIAFGLYYGLGYIKIWWYH